MRFFIRIGVVVGAALGLLLAMAIPSSAVVNGTPDTTNRFSNVGLVAVNGEPLCTGTLYRTSATQTSSNLVLTAAHCIVGFSGQYSITFDPRPSAASTYYTGVAYSNPGYAASPNNSLQQNGTPDAGVIVLDTPVTGIPMADLPTAGLIDTFNPKTQVLTVAGYGIESFSNANDYVAGNRNYKDVTILEGQRARTAASYVKLSNGTCFGDSGGPTFVKGTRTTVAVTSWGQSWVCSGNSYQYRIDSTTALNFLRNPTTVGVHQS